MEVLAVFLGLSVVFGLVPLVVKRGERSSDDLFYVDLEAEYVASDSRFKDLVIGDLDFDEIADTMLSMTPGSVCQEFPGVVISRPNR